MTAYIQRHWQGFSDGRPGRRFEDRYRRHQKGGRIIWKILNVTLGVVLVALSALGGLLPVLGWGTAIVGFSLIAGEILFAARLLDKIEKGLWRFVRFCKDVWILANPVGKTLIAALLAALAAGLIYGSYLTVMRMF